MSHLGTVSLGLPGNRRSYLSNSSSHDASEVQEERDAVRKVGIIGAGPAALTCAYQLSKDPSIKPVVFEASDSVGGLSRSLRFKGQVVDLGPHRFFSQDHRVNSLWLEVIGQDYVMVNRLTRILYRQSFFDYPLRAQNALRKLGPAEAAHCLLSYVREQLRPTESRGDFESWVTSQFGKRLYEIFFKSYSEKLWGIPCSELDSDFAAQRIKRFSLGEAIRSSLTRGRGGRHRTLVDEFAYPRYGTGSFYERMAEETQKRGGEIRLDSRVKRVLTENSAVCGIELEDGSQHVFDSVISSMPLTSLVETLPEAPASIKQLAKQLTFRNTILVFLEVERDDVCPDNWLYVQDPNLQVGRITNFRNWSPDLFGDRPNTILSFEYWCGFEDPMWGMDDNELVRLATRELAATSLIDDQRLVVEGMVRRIPRSYPVYRRGYHKILETIQQHLGGIAGLQVIGRYGAFKYNNQDHSILMGLLAAENIVDGAGHNLWEVNSDYECYQESTRITETGLVSQG